MTTQIMITLNQIRKHDPCADGWSKVLKANGGTKADFDKEFPVSSILDSNDLDDTLWVIRCLPEYESLWRKFAWWSATQVVDNAKDERVNKCLEVVKRYSEGLATDEELSAAWSAARSAARSAESAAWSAESAARSAASSAESAESAESAAWSAESAARSAARSAASSAESAESAARSAWSAARSAQEAKLRNLLDTGKLKD